MKRAELLDKLEATDKGIERLKGGRRAITRRIRALRAERLAVLALLGDGSESKKTAPRGRGGERNDPNRNVSKSTLEAATGKRKPKAEERRA